MDCTVDNCEREATQRYVWAWGEEGVCCDEHRAHLESKSAQLGRGIAFVAADDTRRDYKAPALEVLAPEVGKLKMQNAELVEQLKIANARIGELELKVYQLEGELDEAKKGA